MAVTKLLVDDTGSPEYEAMKKAITSMNPVLNAPTTRTVDAGNDWSITVPSNTDVQRQDGDSCFVINFTLKELHSEFGIYRGKFPQYLSENEKVVSRQTSKIDGQNVVWRVWKEKSNCKESVRAETFLTTTQLISGTVYVNRQILHIFLRAPDEKRLAELQEIVSSLKMKDSQKIDTEIKYEPPKGNPKEIE